MRVEYSAYCVGAPSLPGVVKVTIGLTITTE